mmetsp:Transcript_90653/g.293448  ORF Transcript_90653/g.293448 Transcript_90653/m.293448 type:complete len:115 (-) Transcript_90653:1456-1800(-)
MRMVRRRNQQVAARAKRLTLVSRLGGRARQRRMAGKRNQQATMWTNPSKLGGLRLESKMATIGQPASKSRCGGNKVLAGNQGYLVVGCRGMSGAGRRLCTCLVSWAVSGLVGTW